MHHIISLWFYQRQSEVVKLACIKYGFELKRFKLALFEWVNRKTMKAFLHTRALRSSMPFPSVCAQCTKKNLTAIYKDKFD